LTTEETHVYNKFYLTLSAATSEEPWWFPTFLQNVWKDYGLTFSNDCLMSASLAASYCSSFQRHSGVVQDNGAERDRQLSRFYVNLIKALDRKDISELHLFAISVVISVEQNLARRGEEGVEPHLWGFGAVLRFLIGNRKHLIYSNGEWRPNHLFAFLLIYARVITMVCIQERVISPKRGYELLCNLGNLSSYFENPSSAPDSRIAFAFPKQSLRNQDLGHFQGLRSALSSIRVDLFQFALKAFRAEISEPPSSRHSQLGLLRLAEDRLKMIRNLEVVKDVFFRVKLPTLVALTDKIPRFDFAYASSVLENLEYCFQDYLSLSALVLVLKRLVGDFSYDNQHIQRTRESIDVLKTLWSLTRSPSGLCLPISLLLSNLFPWDPDGNKILDLSG
jgi:hypothetical protein